VAVLVLIQVQVLNEETVIMLIVLVVKTNLQVAIYSAPQVCPDVLYR
jgi:hypothetical protein